MIFKKKMQYYFINFLSIIEGNAQKIKFCEATDKKAILKGMKMYIPNLIVNITKVINNREVIIFKNKTFAVLKNKDEKIRI